MGAAEARTVRFADLAASAGPIDLGGARAQITTLPAEAALSRAELRDALLLVCDEPRGGNCRERGARARAQSGAFLTIFLDEGVSFSNLSFDDHFAGEAPDEGRTVSINGIAYTLGELSRLTLTGQTVVINLDAAAAQQLSLRSFDLSALDAPLPAAGLLMIAGLGGIAFARRARKLR
jgi:hypothetical protein